MKFFKKKKLFQITWDYGEIYNCRYVEVVKGKDIHEAWNKLRKQYRSDISLVEWTELG